MPAIIYTDMEIKIITPVAIASVLLFILDGCDCNEMDLKHFIKSSCSNQLYTPILNAPFAEETVARSAMYCAFLCGQNTQCKVAVFRQSTHWCKHIFANEGNPTMVLPAYANENGCAVFHKKNKPICQNGGEFSGSYQCLCPMEFYGPECELPKPIFCNSNSWREVTPADYSILTESPLPIKLVTFQGTSRTISNTNTILFLDNGVIRFESHNYLTVNMSTENFEIPLKREFNVYSEVSLKITKAKVTMAGKSTHLETPNAVYQLLMQEAVDNKAIYEVGVTGASLSRTALINLKVKTDEDRIPCLKSKPAWPWTGSPDEAIAELKAGQRLIMRDPTMTKFTESTNDIVYQKIKNEVGLTTTSFAYPLYYYSTKHSITQNKHSVTRWYIETGTHKKSDQISRTNRIDFDRCWLKLTPSSDDDKLGGLREAILSRGQEVRLVMGSTTATDITMVTVTDSDVIASLAEYLMPKDYVSSLGASSKFRIWSVSLSKTLTECEMTFQGSTVHQIINGTYPSTLEWVVSSRVWVSKFVQTWTASGVEVSGSHNDVYSAAVNGRSIRVCVEKTIHVSTCFTGVSLTLDDSNQHVMIQSPAALGVDLTPDRTFSGDVGPDCKRTVYLVSTKGWVKTASYVIGIADPPDAVVTLTCLKITWFGQM